MTAPTIDQLATILDEPAYLAQGLAAAASEGLTTTTWRVGDPDRTLFVMLARALAAHDQRIAEFVMGSLLSLADGEWLKLQASEVYGVEPLDGAPATPTVSLRNTGGGHYTIDVGDATFSSTITGKTYHNTSGPHALIGVGSTATLTLVCDDIGTDGSVAINDIDTMVTSYLGVEITGSTASNGRDDQDSASLKAQCRATLGALSPNGPADAYEFVCRESRLTGNTEITRAKSYGDSDLAEVVTYVAGPAGVVSSDALTAAQNACEIWATPLTISQTVVNATPVVQAVTAVVTGTNLPSDYPSLAEAAATAVMSLVDISGLLARSALIAALHKLAVDAGASNVSVSLSVPASDVSLTAGRVIVPGTVTIG